MLAAAVLLSLVGLGIHQAMAGRIDRRIGATVGIVWAFMLAVVWFDERTRPVPNGTAWLAAIVLDAFVVICLTVVIAG